LHPTDPRRRLLPGSYPDRVITRLDIATAAGHVPALHIVPAGGARAAVCYVHGSGSCKEGYTWGIAEALAARGLAVLLFDLDGHGESPQVQAFPDIVQSTARVWAWLREHYARVGVIGNSLGGCIAGRAAADGAALDALVIMEAPTRLSLTRQQIRAEALRLLNPAVLGLLRQGSPAYLVRTWRDTPPIRARIGTRELVAALDVLGSLRRIAAEHAALPLLLVYAERDAIVPREQAEEVCHAKPAGAAFHLLRGASHLSLVVDPRMHLLVSTWLAARLAGKE
jgi:alpha-beta hydrolase superfamily lysophospholipase